MENIFSGHNGCLDVNWISLDNGLQRGDYVIGPKVMFSSHPISDITECIAKRVNSDEFVILKILNCSDSTDTLGKILLHNENVVLSLLQNKPGVIHHHGLFKYCNKYILVLDCVMSHEHDEKGDYKNYINLQQYVIQKKQLRGVESLEIFSSVVSILKMLHENNIIHRDLKLGNMVYNKRTKSITLVNFSLSKHLIRDNEMLEDQCGSLAYVSPEVLNGKPYDGKASDMWAVGVLLYTMCCGQFPFYDNDQQELFKKICNCDFIIPMNSKRQGEYDAIYDLIKMLIVKDPLNRLTAVQTLEITQQLLAQLSDPTSFTSKAQDTQVVPDQEEEVTFTDCLVPIGALDLNADLQETLLPSNFPSCLLDSYIAEVSLLCDLSIINDSKLPNDTYHRLGDFSFAAGEVSSSVTLQSTSCIPNDRLTVSTENFSGEPSSAYLGTQRGHRSLFEHSTGESRARRHSAASSLEFRMRQHSGSESRVRRHSAAPAFESRNRHHSVVSTIESRVRRHSAALFRLDSHVLQRRRSHDIRDEQMDLLEQLHVVATRRTPSQTSARHNSNEHN